VKDKSGVALECERPSDIVYPSLIWVGPGALIDIYSKWSTAVRGRFKLVENVLSKIHLQVYEHSPSSYYVVEDTRILGCVADSLQQRRFASISQTDYKDTKASIFCSEIIWITHNA
jgi:hypothetical protein